MKKNKITFLLFFLTVITLSGEDILWTGNINHNWNHPFNWDLNRTPSQGDNVYINSVSDSVIVNTGIFPRYAAFISNKGKLMVNGRLTLDGASSYAIHNLGVITNNGIIDITDTGSTAIYNDGISSVINNTGIINISNNINGSGFANHLGTLNNLQNGEINISDSKIVSISNTGGSINNNGTINTTKKGIFNSYQSTFKNLLIGKITITNSSSSGIKNHGENTFFDNSGRIIISGGTGGGLYNTSEFINRINGEININDISYYGLLNINNDINAKFINEGTIAINNIKDFNGIANNNGSVFINTEFGGIYINNINLHGIDNSGIFENHDNGKIEILDCNYYGINNESINTLFKNFGDIICYSGNKGLNNVDMATFIISIGSTMIFSPNPGP